MEKVITIGISDRELLKALYDNMYKDEHIGKETSSIIIHETTEDGEGIIDVIHMHPHTVYE